RSAAQVHGIFYVPGAADLGDFDATSTTIALAPAGEEHTVPDDLLRATFERYWRNFTDRRDGKVSWDAYTPYELRVVGTFVRLGSRERAHELLDYFFRDQRPAAWNQWAEVVGREPRQPRFIGDMPNAWIASDYTRSARVDCLRLHPLGARHVRFRAPQRQVTRAGGRDSKQLV